MSEFCDDVSKFLKFIDTLSARLLQGYYHTLLDMINKIDMTLNFVAF